MDVNAMCAKYWPGAGLRSFTVKVDKSNEGWTPLLGGWALFEGPDAPPTTADLQAKEAEYEAFLDAERAATSKKAVEVQLRNNPAMKAQVALQAQAQGKTVDEIIAETVSKV